MRLYLYRFDKSVTDYIKSWSPRLDIFMNKVTLLADPVLLVFVIGAAVAAYNQNAPGIGSALIGVVVACALNEILKKFLRRKRPDTLYASLMRFKTYSFPSGHAFAATVMYGLIAYLSWNFLHAPWNSLAIGFLVLLILTIGVSRVYLGAHYPSDVVAGWLLGFIGLMIVLNAALI